MNRAAAFLVTSFALSWGAWAIGFVRHSAEKPSLADLGPWLIVGSFGPAAAALILLATTVDRRTELLGWVKSLVRFKAPLRLWALLLFGLPVSLAVSAFLFGLKPSASHPAAAVWLTLAIAPFNGIFAALLGVGPLGEEPGWRGYLNKVLLGAGTKPWLAAGMMGLAWSVWHLPLALFTRDFVPMGVPVTLFLLLYLVSTLAMAFVLQQIWRFSESGLFCIWFHGQCNAALPFLAGNLWVAGHPDPAMRMLVPVVGTVISAALFSLLRHPGSKLTSSA